MNWLKKMLENSLVLFFPFLMIYASMSDLFSMTISNKISIVLMAGFMVFAYFMGMSWSEIGWHWVMFAIVLSAGFALFSFGAIGGGDAKLAASTALWLGWGHVVEYLLISALLGAVLTYLILGLRAQILPSWIGKIDWVARLNRSDSGVPYGIALGLGAMLVYPNTPWMAFVYESAARL